MAKQQDWKQQEITDQQLLQQHKDKLMLTLTPHIQQAIPDCPRDLITSYLTDRSTLPLKHIAITSDSEKLKNFLERRLFKLGYPNVNLDDLIEAANKTITA